MRWLLTLLALLPSPALAQQKPLEVEVLRTSAGSLYANIALIKGDKKAVHSRGCAPRGRHDP
jgi:hypothetical protein